MGISIRKSRWYLTLPRIRYFLQGTGVRMRYLAIPSALAFLASICEGIAIWMLIPAVKGFLEGDFNFVLGIPVLGTLVSYFLPFAGESGKNIFLALLLLMLVLIVAKNIFLYFASVLTLFFGRNLGNSLRKDIFARYLSFGKIFFDQNDIGHLYQVLLNFTEMIAVKLKDLEGILYILMSFVVYVVIMCFISWQLTLLIFLAFPFFHFSLSWLIKKIKKTSHTLVESHSKISGKIADSLFCIPLIKANSSEEREKKWFNYASDRVFEAQFSLDKKQSLVAPFQNVLSFGILLILVMFMVVIFSEKKSGDVGAFAVFSLLLKRSSGHFGIFNKLRASMASIKGPVHAISEIFENNNKFFIKNGPRRFCGVERDIVFDKVRFCYPKGIVALEDLSVVFEKDKTTAIVGSSGSGKTTLISLIMRFYEIEQGSILIDGIDIREFSIQSLMEKISFVSQDVFVLNASIRINVTYGLTGSISEEQIKRAMALAGLGELVGSLPDGMDTNVGDRGVKLSGGEKQRISIARAIMKNSEIIIFDEATSALDSVTEGAIQKALSEFTRGKTSIVVAHRLSTIKNADKIVVLEEGKVMESGSLDSLIANKGKFYEFWQMQKFF